jgi:hypothetical protein
MPKRNEPKGRRPAFQGMRPFPNHADEQFKRQMAKGKPQMVFHLPFAICPLNFELLLGMWSGLWND